MFVNTNLRRDGQIGNLIDMIHVEMLSAGPSFRPTAKEVCAEIVRDGKGNGIFKKEDCCKAEQLATRVSDPTEKSLLEKMAQLSLTEIEKVDKHGFMGELGDNCFRI